MRQRGTPGGYDDEASVFKKIRNRMLQIKSKDTAPHKVPSLQLLVMQSPMLTHCDPPVALLSLPLSFSLPPSLSLSLSPPHPSHALPCSAFVFYTAYSW